MARGDSCKATVREKIMEVFPNAFVAADGKTIRVPLVENGDTIEVKVSLVAAKDIEGGGAVIDTPPILNKTSAFDPFNEPKVEKTILVEPTQEEIDNVNSFLSALDF